MKWLFLFGLSATAAIIMFVLSGVAAGKHALSGLELFSQEHSVLILFLVQIAAWMGLINDIAAKKNLSAILGQKVQFQEVTMYDGLEISTRITSLRSKLYVAYPAFIMLSFVALTVRIARF